MDTDMLTSSPTSSSASSKRAKMEMDATPPPPQPPQPPPCPPYDGLRLAKEAFSHPCFYDNGQVGADAASHLRKDFLRDEDDVNYVLQLFRTDKREFSQLLRSIRARESIVKKYLESADETSRRLVAGKVLEKQYNCNFKECSIMIGTVLDGLKPPTSPAPAATSTASIIDAEDDDDSDEVMAGAKHNKHILGTLDLAFLEPLQISEDPFLSPKKIYVRKSMQTIFGLFAQDVDKGKSPRSRSAALIGSPGVGKSILFFLAALYQAQTKTVIYFRRTKSDEERASVFFMTPQGNGMVHVWFTRNVDKELLDKGLSGFNVMLRRTLPIERDQYYAFVDGPHHTDMDDRLAGDYDYYCTSGGLPLYKNEEGRKRLWILGGWTKEESMEALVSEYPSSTAVQAYDCCGGNIRDMIKFCDSPDNSALLAELEVLVENLDTTAVKLATGSTERNNDAKNPDRLRTMFERRGTGTTWQYRMRAFQVVDSTYLLRLLCRQIDMATFMEGYIVTGTLGERSSQGTFFELAIHQCVLKRSLPQNSNNPLPNVLSVCWSEPSKEEELDSLDKRNCYWIPSRKSFPNIDSAMVHNNTLYVFQMTIKPTHSFNDTTFKADFVDKIRPKVPFNGNVIVYFLHPRGSVFRLPTPIPAGIDYRTHEVDMTSVDALEASVRRLFTFEAGES